MPDDTPTLAAILAKMDEHLHQQDLYMKQQDERLGRQDQILELQTEQIRLMQLSLQRQDQILATIQESTERTAQYHARTAQMLAEHTLLMDRILERLPPRP